MITVRKNARPELSALYSSNTEAASRVIQAIWAMELRPTLQHSSIARVGVLGALRDGGCAVATSRSTLAIPRDIPLPYKQPRMPPELSKKLRTINTKWRGQKLKFYWRPHKRSDNNVIKEVVGRGHTRVSVAAP